MAKQQQRELIIIASPSADLRKRWCRSVRSHYLTNEVTTQTVLQYAVEKLQPSLVLLDEKLLSAKRLEGLSKLVKVAESTQFILLADHPAESDGLTALKAGVKGYCSKQLSPLLIRKAIMTVKKGEPWISRKLTQALVAEFYRLSTQPSKHDVLRANTNLASLSRRELEVARLVKDGARNKEVSRHLGITEKTVKFHLTHIFRKLDVEDRLALALALLDKEHPAGKARSTEQQRQSAAHPPAFPH